MKRILSGLLLVAVLASTAFGLSDKEYLSMKRESKFFREADRKLGLVWRRIEDQVYNAVQSMFDGLKQEQREWIRTGRDRAAQRITKASDNPYLRKEVAYALATYERIGYLEGWEIFVFDDDDD